MSNWKTPFASAVILAISTGTVLGDCPGIGRAAALLDVTWLFRTNGSWRPMAELNLALADGRPRPVYFAYVANEPALKDSRRGILVIKTGVNRPPAGNSGRVTLAREAYEPVERCESYPRFAGGSVSARSYDDYHDYSYRVARTDQNTIKSFHVSYSARTGGCRRSDDDATDHYFAGRWRSNRSQFSFDEKVVANGQHSQFLTQFGATPAYASTMSERRVEMRRYVADKNGLACVVFRIDLKPGTFIRINDLEQRIGLLRADEQSWDWRR